MNTSVCVLQFHIPNDIEPPVLFYYRLTNFYQNHRRYVKSLDTDQLLGKAKSGSSIKSGDCDPLTVDHDGKPYYPCGLIANSLFNDTFETPIAINPSGGSSEPVPYNMTNNGIAWSSDNELYKQTKYTADQIAVPPNWQSRYPLDGYTDERGIPDLHSDEPFQVWMRTAGLPAFSKLALRNDTAVMKQGDYRVVVWDSKFGRAMTC